jgi:hypothetical protein
MPKGAVMATYRKGPGELNWDLKRGDVETVEADFSISLTGYTATAEVLSLVTRERVLSIASSVTAAGTCGVVVMSITAAEMAAIPSGTYLFSMAAAPASGAVRHLLDGWFEVRP